MDRLENPIARRYYSVFYLIGPFSLGLAILGVLGLDATTEGFLLPFVELSAAVTMVALGLWYVRGSRGQTPTRITVGPTSLTAEYDEKRAGRTVTIGFAEIAGFVSASRIPRSSRWFFVPARITLKAPSRQVGGGPKGRDVMLSEENLRRVIERCVAWQAASPDERRPDWVFSPADLCWDLRA